MLRVDDCPVTQLLPLKPIRRRGAGDGGDKNDGPGAARDGHSRCRGLRTWCALLPASGHAVQDIGSLRSGNRRAIGPATRRCRRNLYIASCGQGLRASAGLREPLQPGAHPGVAGHRHVKSDAGPGMGNAGCDRRRGPSNRTSPNAVSCPTVK